jgi:uncharacterized protein (TIGR03435 family)
MNRYIPLAASFLAALAVAAPPQSEVASIKPTAQTMPAGALRGCSSLFKISGDHVNITCVSVGQLIAYAFRTSTDRVTGPDWLTDSGAMKFDIIATIPAGAATGQIPEMLQGLMVDRFKLATHRGTAERPVYALVVAKNGISMKETVVRPNATTEGENTLIGDILVRTTADAAGARTIITENPEMGIVREVQQGPNQPRRWETAATTMAGLADLLDTATPLTLPVIDMTGLKGRYQVTLEVANDVLPRVMEAAAQGGPVALQNVQADLEDAFFGAYNVGLRKLGLQLDRRKGSVETIVVDRAEKMPSEN